MLNRLIREPLIHFLLLGALLFLVYDYQNDDSGDDLPDRIVITEAQVGTLAARWQKKWQRPPTPVELEGLIEQEIRQQVLYREALAMGMDRNDPVVRRRMAQKLEFITSDLSSQVEPGDDQLKVYFDQNANKFVQPGRLSFVQIYLNADRRGAQLDQDAQQLLNALNANPQPANLDTMGDPFMFGQVFDDQDSYQITRIFGQAFSDSLFQVPIGSWQGPVYSGLGMHLVRIDSRSDPALPPLETVRDRVKAEWQEQQRREMDAALYQRMRDKYEIILPQAKQS